MKLTWHRGGEWGEATIGGKRKKIIGVREHFNQLDGNLHIYYSYRARHVIC